MAKPEQKNHKRLLEFEKPLEELYDKLEKLKAIADSGNIEMNEELRLMEKRIEAARQQIFAGLNPIQIVSVARFIERPNAREYVEMIFDDFIELHGDRNFSDDPAMLTGIARLDGRPVVVMGHQKGHSTKENLAHNHAMANPEGYRKALRIMRLAERYNKPIISFIDTPGAYPGIGAEERGQAEAIAKNLREMAELTVPFISIITGEGGSGGALGIAMGNRVLMLEFSIYSVISPEGCASILFRDATRAKDAAIAMKITAKDLLELGVIDEIIKEPIGGAHNDPQFAAKNIKVAILKNLEPLLPLSHRELIADRYNKYRKMGIYNEGD
ncbi:MAG: acetyl-CoA carboxylase carboxyltransferase subunit alpha [Candidatus Margulisbacteria bacterium]|nr:acetyl-CoA carboxylase carboxyltransferase subunit alpha [Candidatus Margulisiibacteriota bacterium]